MPPNIDRALSAQNTINELLNSSASTLTPVPEIQSESTADAIHKLQIQIFTLTDALADLANAVDQMVIQPTRRRP